MDLVEKDIFAVFAYEFEFLQFLVKYRLTPMRSYAVGIVKFYAVAQSEVKCATNFRRNFTVRRTTSLAKQT